MPSRDCDDAVKVLLDVNARVCYNMLRMPIPEELRVLVCGGREWTDRFSIERELKFLRARYGPKQMVVIHGAARGADTIAAEIADRCGMTVVAFPAHWRHTDTCLPDCKQPVGPKAGPIRNNQMLLEGRPEVVLAFHDDIEGKSKGTKDMVIQARRRGVPVFIYGHRDLSNADCVVQYVWDGRWSKNARA